MAVVGVPTAGALYEKVGLGTTAAVPYPTTAAGDLMLLAVCVKNGTQPTLPSGWTSIDAATNTGTSGQPAYLLAYKAATGSETGNLSVTIPAVSVAAQIWTIPDVDLTNPLNVPKSTFNQTTASGTINIPGITTGSDGCLLVVLACNNAAANTATPPGSFTELADLVTGQQTIEFAYRQQALATSTGTETVTWSGSGQAIGILIALNPRVEPTNASVQIVAFAATVVTSSHTDAPAGLADVTIVANDAVSQTNKAQPGVADVVIDALDPFILAASSSVAVNTLAGTLVVPGLAVRIRAWWNGTAYDLWRGNIDSWDLSYVFASTDYQAAAINCTDITKMIVSVNRTALANPVGDGEDSGARIDRILDSAGWSHVDRIIHAGDSTLQATDLSGNPWTEAQEAALSEAGDLFVDPGGRVVFRNRRHVLLRARSTTPQAIFGDQPGELDFHDIEFLYDDDVLYNTVGATVVGGIRQEASDGDSVGRYGARVIEESNLLLETDSEAANWAGWIVALSKDPQVRIASLTVTPRRDGTNLFPVVLSLHWGDRIRINLTPPDGTPRVTRDCFIRGVSHNITAPGVWETTYITEDAAAYRFWVIEDPVLGAVEAAALSF